MLRLGPAIPKGSDVKDSTIPPLVDLPPLVVPHLKLELPA